MQAAGIEVEKYNPWRITALARINNRTHRKIRVVDGRIAYTGGAGIGDEWLEWRDTQFRVEGPVVGANWIEVTGRVLQLMYLVSIAAAHRFPAGAPGFALHLGRAAARRGGRALGVGGLHHPRRSLLQRKRRGEPERPRPRLRRGPRALAARDARGMPGPRSCGRGRSGYSVRSFRENRVFLRRRFMKTG
jgi:hypothetical protein